MQIFGNPIPPSTVRRAQRQKGRFARRFGFDPEARYQLRGRPIEPLRGLLDLQEAVLGEGEIIDPENALVIGTIRMGYGHYRIGLAMASAALSMGRRPYWLDLLAFPETTGAKVIRHQEGLYNLGSRLSRKSRLFDRFYWEPFTTKTLRRLTYNAMDREMCSLLAPIYADLAPSIPVIGTHSWPAQAALQAGMRRVVEAIPDNYPLGLHLAEGAMHTVQTPGAYLGYRLLQDMGRPGEILKPMPASEIACTGHYVDHELVQNLEADCAARLRRVEQGLPRRVLVSIGGAGVQGELVARLVRRYRDELREGRFVLFVNAGDHRAVVDMLDEELDALGLSATRHLEWEKSAAFIQDAVAGGEVSGIHLFYHTGIFAAVYATNLLMRASDLLVTKPSELAYYPIPRLFLPRVGGHEAWGAIRGVELGDSTHECRNLDEALHLLNLLLFENDLLPRYLEAILRNQGAGIYQGAYRAVELALA